VATITVHRLVAGILLLDQSSGGAAQPRTGKQDALSTFLTRPIRSIVLRIEYETDYSQSMFAGIEASALTWMLCKP
jgi:hypothetical protein